MVSICYRPPDLEAIKTSEQLEFSQPKALVLMGDFNHPNICVDGSIAEGK